MKYHGWRGQRRIIFPWFLLAEPAVNSVFGKGKTRQAVERNYLRRGVGPKLHVASIDTANPVAAELPAVNANRVNSTSRIRRVNLS
jgi:hypothetical protein